MALHLIRHPRPAAPTGVCYGRLDVGWAEPVDAAALRAGLPPTIERLVSSPARRCLDLARAWSPTVDIDPAWQELDFGTWEGRPWAEIDRADSDPWAADVWHRSPPGGESYAELTARVRGAVGRLLAAVSARLQGPGARGAGPEIAVVTHAGPMRAVHAAARGLDERTVPDLPLAFGQVCTFEWADLAHLS